MVAVDLWSRYPSYELFTLGVQSFAAEIIVLSCWRIKRANNPVANVDDELRVLLFVWSASNHVTKQCLETSAFAANVILGRIPCRIHVQVVPCLRMEIFSSQNFGWL